MTSSFVNDDVGIAFGVPFKDALPTFQAEFKGPDGHGVSGDRRAASVTNDDHTTGKLENWHFGDVSNHLGLIHFCSPSHSTPNAESWGSNAPGSCLADERSSLTEATCGSPQVSA